MYSATGRTWIMSPEERAAGMLRVAEALKPCGEYAAARDVVLAVEPLNRFETSFINTTEQGLELVDAVASPGVGLCLDTFHMNIEEKDPAGAILDAAPHLAHVQLCGSDRGAPGSDHIDWPSIRDALIAARYGGPLCIESFTSENRTIARAAAIWRPLAPSQDRLATDGLRFLRGLFA